MSDMRLSCRFQFMSCLLEHNDKLKLIEHPLLAAVLNRFSHKGVSYEKLPQQSVCNR